MPSMRNRRLLLAAAALSTVLGSACGKRPHRYANTKRPSYPDDAGAGSATDATPAPDASDPVEPPKTEP